MCSCPKIISSACYQRGAMIPAWWFHHPSDRSRKMYGQTWSACFSIPIRRVGNALPTISDWLSPKENLCFGDAACLMPRGALRCSLKMSLRTRLQRGLCEAWVLECDWFRHHLLSRLTSFHLVCSRSLSSTLCWLAFFVAVSRNLHLTRYTLAGAVDMRLGRKRF